MNQTKRAMAMTVIVAVAALLPRSHLADGNNANDPKPPPTNQDVLNAVTRQLTDIRELLVGTSQTSLASKIDALDSKVAALQAVAAKRGVAVIRAIPGHIRDGDYLPNPRLFILGSTIKGFHDTLAWGAELNPNSNRGAGPLPAGTYLIEMPTAWVTTDRPAHSYAGSIMITKLE